MRTPSFILGFLAGCLSTLLFVTFLPQWTIQHVPEGGEGYVVTRVIDGDTIDVSVNGATERVRIIGIDTPETVDSRKKVQCFGPEASARMTELLSLKRVQLERKSSEDKDDYGRLLRYVRVEGRDAGALLLAEGFARALCEPFPHPKCTEYAVLEREAKAKRLGRWGAC